MEPAPGSLCRTALRSNGLAADTSAVSIAGTVSGRRRRLVGLALGALAVAGVAASCTPEVTEAQDRLNADRIANGRAPLAFNLSLYLKAQAWSETLASEGRLRHSVLTDNNPNTGCYRKLGENVGFAGTIAGVQAAFMNSPGHRANILDPAYNTMGVGVTRAADGRYFVVQEFMQYSC